MTSGKVYPFTVNHKILSANDDLKVSLVELETSKNKWNSVRGYCAMRLLSPALGDSIYGSCVQEVNKMKIAVEPFSPAANKPYVTIFYLILRTRVCVDDTTFFYSFQKIPSRILDVLGLKFQQQSVIPLHIHLAKLNFLKYRTDGRTFTAKPPDHFLWTCEKLGLTVPDEFSDNRVSDSLLQSTDAEAVEEEENSECDDTSDDEEYTSLASLSQRSGTNKEDIEDNYLDVDDTGISQTGS